MAGFLLVVITSGFVFGPETFSTETDCRAAARLMVRAVVSYERPKAICFEASTGQVYAVEERDGS